MLQQVTTSYNKLQSKLITKKTRRILKIRTPAVTRTISTLNITVLGMDTVSCEPMTKTYPIYESDAPKDEAKLFNYIRKMYETESSHKDIHNATQQVH